MLYYENWLQTKNTFTVNDGKITITCDELEMTLGSDNLINIKQNGYITVNGEKLKYDEDYKIHPWQPIVLYAGKDMADVIPTLAVGSKISVPAITALAYYELGQRRVSDQNMQIGTAAVIGLLSGYAAVAASIEAGAVTLTAIVSGATTLYSLAAEGLLAFEDEKSLTPEARESIGQFKTFYNYLVLADIGVNLYSSLRGAAAIEKETPNLLKEVNVIYEGRIFRFGKSFTSKISTNTTLNSTEKTIAKKAHEIMNSSEFKKIINAHSSKTPIQIEINGRTISYDDAPFSGMTWFEKNGFNIGREAFNSDEELVKTVLHEMYRLETSTLRGIGTAAEVSNETQAAFTFAEKSYVLFE
jgi:hypothetical protein